MESNDFFRAKHCAQRRMIRQRFARDQPGLRSDQPRKVVTSARHNSRERASLDRTRAGAVAPRDVVIL